MADLINGRTPEEIKQALEWMVNGCPTPETECEECRHERICKKITAVYTPGDALKLIQYLEAQQPKWISVKDELPPRERNILAVNGHGCIKILAFWKKKEKRWTWIEESRFTHRNDITHWMALPQPPEGA